MILVSKAQSTPTSTLRQFLLNSPEIFQGFKNLGFPYMFENQNIDDIDVHIIIRRIYCNSGLLILELLQKQMLTV